MRCREFILHRMHAVQVFGSGIFFRVGTDLVPTAEDAHRHMWWNKTRNPTLICV
jgi:hypothetical protein